MDCKPSLYHYNGCCFNKSRIPDGRVAIKISECEAIEHKEEPVTAIIH